MVGPAAAGCGPPQGCHREPTTKIYYRPGIDQKHTQACGREECTGFDSALPDSAERGQHHERCSPGCGSRPAEKCHIRETCTCRQAERPSTPQSNAPTEEKNPGRDDPDVKS